MSIGSGVLFGLLIWLVISCLIISKRESIQLMQELDCNSMKFIKETRYYLLNSSCREMFFKYKLTSLYAKCLTIGLILSLFYPATTKFWLLP